MFNKLFANCLLVENFEEALDFYINKLGLEQEEQNGKLASFKMEGTSLAIFEKREATLMFPKSHMNKGGGNVLSFQVDSVEETIKKLKSNKVKIFEGPKVTPWGQTVAYFKDPDGNIWEVSNKNF